MDFVVVWGILWNIVEQIQLVLLEPLNMEKYVSNVHRNVKHAIQKLTASRAPFIIRKTLIMTVSDVMTIVQYVKIQAITALNANLLSTYWTTTVLKIVA